MITALSSVIEYRDLKSEVSNIELVEGPWDIPGAPVLNLISGKSLLSTRAPSSKQNDDCNSAI